MFEMIRMITAKTRHRCLGKKLQTLLRLQQEPIAITAAMIGSHVICTGRLGAARKKNYSTVFDSTATRGSGITDSSARPTASHYTLGQIEACRLQVLLELDQSLKSQPVSAQTY